MQPAQNRDDNVVLVMRVIDFLRHYPQLAEGAPEMQPIIEETQNRLRAYLDLLSEEEHNALLEHYKIQATTLSLADASRRFLDSFPIPPLE